MAKVLVVDDDVDILQVVNIILTSKGYDVQVESDGGKAIDKVLSFQPDAVLLDVNLNGYDGRAICRELKGNAETEHIPIVMFSANYSDKAINDSCNADGFIAKPFEVTHLLMKLNRVILN